MILGNSVSHVPSSKSVVHLSYQGSSFRVNVSERTGPLLSDCRKISRVEGPDTPYLKLGGINRASRGGLQNVNAHKSITIM